MRRESLIVYGGSFDPIHNGHLRIARRARDVFRSDVCFVPNFSPRWKKPSCTYEERLSLLKKALKSEGSPSFFISEVEAKRGEKVSYTVDTLVELKKEYPDRRLILLIGADEANSFPRWKDAEKITRLADVYYVGREGVHIDAEAIRKYGLRELEGCDPGPVSSSAIRKLASLDAPLSVIEEIVEKGYYFMDDLKSLLGENRLVHSISVASLAYRIAISSRIEKPERAYQAGLLHDIGKYVGEVASRYIVAREYPGFEDYPTYALHQWVGAYLARTKFGLEDKEVLDAIECHCTGKAHMIPLSKIVYSADKIEPGRGFDSRKLIRKCMGNYYVGFLAVLDANREYLLEHGGADNPLSKEAFALYLGKE